MNYDVEKIENPESAVHYKFTTYKTVKDKNGNDVEVVDRTTQYTLSDLEGRKAKAQAKVDEYQEMIDSINNLE